MNLCEKRDYLNQYRWLDRQIEHLLWEHRRWLNRSDRIELFQNCNRPTVEEISKLEQKICSELCSLIQQRREISDLIASVKEPSFQYLLQLRYLEGNTWEMVAEKMNYNRRWVLRLHNEILTKLNFPLEAS